MMNPERWLTVAGNLLPVVGVLCFGWDAVQAVYFLWLEGLLANLELIVPGLARNFEQSRGFNSRPEPQNVKRALSTLIAIPLLAFIGATALAILLAPALGMGLSAVEVLERSHSTEEIWEVLWTTDVAAWSLLELAIRGRRIRRALMERHAGPAPTGRGIAEFLILILRAELLIGLAFCARQLGQSGLVAFLLAASALTTYLETNRDWPQRLAAALGSLASKCRQRT